MIGFPGRRVLHTYPAALVMLAMLLGPSVLTSCAASDEVQRRIRAEQLKHQDVQPPTIGGYISATNLWKTRQIEYRDPSTGQARIVNDQRRIERALELFAARGNESTIDPMYPTPAESVELILVLDDTERRIHLTYNASTNHILLYNIPDVSWPEHYIGTYSVAPPFGSALLAILAGETENIEP